MKPLAQIAFIAAVVANLTACDSPHSNVSMATGPSQAAPELSPETLAKLRSEMSQRQAEFEARLAAEGEAEKEGRAGEVVRAPPRR